MGKAQRERVGRKRLRTAYEKLRKESSDHVEASIPNPGVHDGGIKDEAVGTVQDGEVGPSRPSRIERKLRKKSKFMEKLTKGGLGVKKVATKKESKASRGKKMFSFESLIQELGNVDVAERLKHAKKERRKRDFSRHRNRGRMMAEFSQRVLEVRNDPVYSSDPFGAAMSFLDNTLPVPRTREDVDEEWRKEQRKLMKKQGKKRLGWHDK